MIIDLFVSEVKRIMPYKRRLSAETSQDSASAEEPTGKCHANAAKNNGARNGGNKKAPADMRRRSEGSRGFI